MNCLSSSGIPAPLGTYNRKPKQETFGLIPDDGYRELVSTNKEECKPPACHAQKTKPVLSMINKYNIAELSLVDRPVQGTNSGFGAVIVKHPNNHDARYFRTENRDNYGENCPKDAGQTVGEFNALQRTLAGGQIRGYDQQGIKKISNLVGEIYGKNFDPQEQTNVQRSWLYQQDPAVRAVDQGKAGKNQLNMYDNANSLCLGEGIHATKKFDDSVGAFRRIRCDVTMSKNTTITRK